jgi:hypothetical protein
MKFIPLLFATLMATIGTGCDAYSAQSADPAAAALSATPAALSPLTCTIRTNNTGNYLTAVGGGGRTTDVLHTDAIRADAWEQFTFVDAGDGGSVIHYGIRTITGNYLTAVGGGGRNVDVIHSDATHLQAWEQFTLIALGGGVYAIQTVDGHFLTAVGGGGRTTDVIHSDATHILSWEMFAIGCQLPTSPSAPVI